MDDDEEGIPRLSDLINDAFDDTSNGYNNDRRRSRQKSMGGATLNAHQIAIKAFERTNHLPTRRKRAATIVSTFASAASDSEDDYNSNHTAKRATLYPCQFCDYRTTAASCLADHMRTHTGERPFECAICDYMCNVVSNLKRHVQTRHKDLFNAGANIMKCSRCEYVTTDTGPLRIHNSSCGKVEATEPKKISQRRKSMPALKTIQIKAGKVEKIEKENNDNTVATAAAPKVNGKSFVLHPNNTVTFLNHKESITLMTPKLPLAANSSDLEAQLKASKPKQTDQFKISTASVLPTEPKRMPIVLKLKPMHTLLAKTQSVRLPSPAQTPPVTISSPVPKPAKPQPPAASSKAPYICPICNYNTIDNGKWQRHLNEHRQTAQCVVCKERFASDEVMEIHLDVHHSAPTSSVLTKPLDDIDIGAIQITKSKTMQFVCNLCGFCTMQPYEFDAHEQRHVRMDGWRKEHRISFDIINLNGDIISQCVNYSHPK